ncbi:DNA polymerase III subunit beta, partial [Patescibacteria group bacterium]|nr:DNA polymerase III subunit beta [Patescibacteria group bacterium]
MKLESLKEKLSNAVSKAEKITGKNLTLPVLNNLLLKTKDGVLKVIATNLDLGIEISVPVNIAEEGEVVVPGNILNNLISGDFKSSKINLETKDGNLIVLTESNSTIIKTQPNDDFPTIPRLKDGNSFLINSKKFIKGLRSVWYSSSTSNIKPELSSVLVYSDSKNIIFVATDSFRLAEIKIEIDSPVDFEQILIPFKNIPDIIKVFDDIDDD